MTIDEEEGMTEGAVDSIAVEVAEEMIEGILDFCNPFHLASFLIIFTNISLKPDRFKALNFL